VRQPGDKERMHWHLAFMVHVIAGGTVRNNLADGNVVEAAQDGDVLHREPQTHRLENIGTPTLHLALVELKGLI